MTIYKKSISYFLVVAMCFSLIVATVPFAHAYTTGDLIYDSASVDHWVSWMENNTHGSNIVDLKPSFWNVIDLCFSASGCGSLESYTDVLNAMETWNGRMHRFDPVNVLALSIFALATSSKDIPTAYVAFDSDFGVYRLREYHTDIWLVNSAGYFPYYAPPADEDGNVPAVGEDTTGIQWLEGVFKNETHRHFVSKDVLEDYADYYGGTLSYVENYYGIFSRDGGGTKPYGSYWLCDPHGYPFVTVRNSDSTAVDTPNDYIIDEDGNTSTGQLIDVENNIVWFPDGTWYYLDQLIYDESTKTYNVDSHDQYVYDSFNNSFNTTSYYYEYNYYITHTSITYIGQTEEYEDPYQLYYKLPDGRSSADLTAEELEQLSLAFVDVINYARSADDINMRALYHFDGNLADASYWSYCSTFDWVEGASITYMDEGAFDGSLYLDEKKHVFDVILPSADMSGDFTIQFRYYQSYTSAPKTDSSISLGSQAVFHMDGVTMYDRDLGTLTGIPTGSWNEIALVREGDYLYYYLNGLCYGNVYIIGSYGNTITFTFGSEQQTYKKLDELRVTKGALYSCGEDYQPSLVPYDTNLALILPDGEVPIADEYWTITPPEDNMLSFDFSDLGSLAIDHFDPYGTGWGGAASSSTLQSYFKARFSTFELFTFRNTASVTQGENCVEIEVDDPTEITDTYTVYGSEDSAGGVWWDNFPKNCLGLCFSAEGYECWKNTADHYTAFYSGSGSAVKTYCLTVVDNAGNSSYVVFKNSGVQGDVLTYVSHSFTTFDIYSTTGYRIGNGAEYLFKVNTPYYCNYRYSTSSTYSWNGPHFFYFVPRSGSGSIAYMELVEATEPQFDLVFNSAVYSSGQLEEAPVLAVKSNTTVTEYQIGGVRPSYPTKGQVWALVENGRITSLQQYSGYAWLQVDGRIWTGERWIPTSSFDIFTMQDFWDMTGTTPKDEYTYIYSESGFWDWWQKQWLLFTGTLWDKMDGSGGGGDSVPDLEDDPLLDDDDKQKFDENEYTGIVKTMRKIYDFMAGFFSDFTVNGINDFLGFLDDKNSIIYGLFNLSGLG